MNEFRLFFPHKLFIFPIFERLIFFPQVAKMFWSLFINTNMNYNQFMIISFTSSEFDNNSKVNLNLNWSMNLLFNKVFTCLIHLMVQHNLNLLKIVWKSDSKVTSNHETEKELGRSWSSQSRVNIEENTSEIFN